MNLTSDLTKNTLEVNLIPEITEINILKKRQYYSYLMLKQCLF